MEKIFDKKNVILIRVDDSDLASFLVDSDINDTGDYEWRIIWEEAFYRPI